MTGLLTSVPNDPPRQSLGGFSTPAIHSCWEGWTYVEVVADMYYIDLVNLPVAEKFASWK